MRLNPERNRGGSVAKNSWFKRKKSISFKTGVYQDRKSIYLIFQTEKGKKTAVNMAKSLDGLDFKSCPYSEAVFKNYFKTKEETQKKLNFYFASLTAGSERLKSSNFTIEGTVETNEGFWVFYHYRNQDADFEVGTALFDKNEPSRLLWRLSYPVWKTDQEWRGKEVNFVGLATRKKAVYSYWQVKEVGIFIVTYPKYRLNRMIEIKSRSAQLFKPKENPILSPKKENSWEAFNTFNPAAVYESDKVHILYRAQGYDYISVVGYAVSKDGIHIDGRLDYPVFIPTQPFEDSKGISAKEVDRFFVSGGGYGGCEDPRLTKIDDRVYMTYVAFDGRTPPRIALTSISLENFLDHNWLWEKPVLISPPGVVDKSACLLPEKINGKYVIFHRIFPNILIDFVDDLNFDGKKYLKGEYKITVRSPMWWDSRKIGAGAPPIRTDAGWLLIYEGVDDKDAGRYKIGAMLLDLENPTKVLYRSNYPILEPNEKYENEGFKAGIVYPCGAVIIKETLFVYYGGADSYVCVATAPLEKFLEELKSSGTPKTDATLIGKLS
ncbi:MAG: hypothetical protein ABH867_00975 [Patescibacteria group bacterium]